jgi:hypothetical protein
MDALHLRRFTELLTVRVVDPTTEGSVAEAIRQGADCQFSGELEQRGDAVSVNLMISFSPKLRE